MAGERFARFCEQVNRAYQVFCVYVYDFSMNIKQMSNAPVDKDYQISIRDMFKELGSKIGVRSKEANQLYNEFYKGQEPPASFKKFLLERFLGGFRPKWREEARLCSIHNIKIDNAGQFTPYQLRELRYMEMRGCNTTPLRNPEISAFQMRLAAPYLDNAEFEVTRDNVLDFRRRHFEREVTEFFETLNEIKYEIIGKDPPEKEKAEEKLVGDSIEEPLEPVDSSELEEITSERKPSLDDQLAACELMRDLDDDRKAKVPERGEKRSSLDDGLNFG